MGCKSRLCGDVPCIMLQPSWLVTHSSISHAAGKQSYICPRLIRMQHPTTTNVHYYCSSTTPTLQHFVGSTWSTRNLSITTAGTLACKDCTHAIITQYQVWLQQELVKHWSVHTRYCASWCSMGIQHHPPMWCLFQHQHMLGLHLL
jgi:hypothetical protein